MGGARDELVCVWSYSYHPQAVVAQSALEANGIEAVISADDAGGMLPYFNLGPFGQGSGGVRLLVKKEDAEEALKILKGEGK